MNESLVRLSSQLRAVAAGVLRGVVVGFQMGSVAGSVVVVVVGGGGKEEGASSAQGRPPAIVRGWPDTLGSNSQRPSPSGCYDPSIRVQQTFGGGAGGKLESAMLCNNVKGGRVCLLQRAFFTFSLVYVFKQTIMFRVNVPRN